MIVFVIIYEKERFYKKIHTKKYITFYLITRILDIDTKHTRSLNKNYLIWIVLLATSRCSFFLTTQSIPCSKKYSLLQLLNQIKRFDWKFHQNFAGQNGWYRILSYISTRGRTKIQEMESDDRLLDFNSIKFHIPLIRF